LLYLTSDVKSFYAIYRSIAVIIEFSVDEGHVSLLKGHMCWS
jgi:hypothetical protein